MMPNSRSEEKQLRRKRQIARRAAEVAVKKEKLPTDMIPVMERELLDRYDAALNRAVDSIQTATRMMVSVTLP